MDCICLKRKHRNKREQKKFRPLTPHVSPTHSQPSTLGHERLPKVNSTGLWIGTPSLYSGAPSQAYYYGRPHGSSKHRIEQPLNIQRAASETRIPQPMPVHGGQRIYHSQPLAPLYEVPPIAHSHGHSSGMEIYDVYQFGGGAGGSRSKLIETKHSPYYYNDYGEFRMNTRLERSKSDAQDRRTPRSDYSKPQSRPGRSSSQENKGRQSQSRDNGSSQRSFASDDRNKKVSKSMESLKGGGVQKATYEHVHMGHVNVAYSPDARKAKAAPKPATTSTIEVTKPIVQNGTANVPRTEVISPSATDSMKLLAKNKTDDQKTQPNFSPPVMVEKDVDMTNDGKDIGFQHYKYQEDIYTLPNKNGVINEADDYGNPIINRMKEMVIEKSRHSNPPTPRGDSSDPYEVINSTAVTKTSATSAGIYEEVTKVTKVTKTEVTESFETENSGNDALDGLVLPDNLEVDKDQSEDLPSKTTLPVPEVITSTQTLSVVTDKLAIPPSPAGSRHKNAGSPRPSISDMDGATDATAGKITASAFEFLDNYLEDDDGSHIDSPPLSPGPMRVEGVVN